MYRNFAKKPIKGEAVENLKADLERRKHPGRPRKGATKSEILPRIRIEKRRLERYLKALERCQKRHPDLTLAAWMRFACDQQADQDLGRE